MLGLRAARTGRSFLHINHTLPINDFYVQLLTTTRAAGGRLIWMGQDQALTAYLRNGKPTLTPDGAAEVKLGDRRIRAYIEIDRGTERRLWLQAKFQRYLMHQGGRVGADQLHILFVVPGPAREATLRKVGESTLRWANRPTPGFWATTTALLAAHGPLGPVWARLPGNGERVRLLDLAA